MAYHSRKYKLDEALFSVWTSDMAYVLGFWFADGNMRISKSYRVRFFSNDKKHLVSVNKIFSSNSPLLKRKDCNGYTLILRSKRLYHDLLDLGGIPAKSTRIVMPFIPNIYLPDFIRGYFDGDGSVHYISYKATKNKKTYKEMRSNFTSGSKIFLEQLREILTEKLKLAKRVIGQYGPNQFKLGYGQKDTYKLLNYMYYPKHSISLKRKAEFLQKFKT